MAGALVQGFKATERLFTDWQEAGLIDRPEKKGLGRGRGISALWPESQMKLWLLLLQKRGDITQVPVLCNIPVGLWLYFGDRYVPIRQVRKCMKTWSFRYGSSRGHKQAKQIARQLLAGLPLSGSKSARADLVSAMAHVLLLGIPSDQQRRDLRERLIGSLRIAGWEESAAAATVELVLIRLLGASAFLAGNVPDHVLAWARAWHLFGLRNYLASYAAGELPNVPGVDMSAPNFDRLIINACRDLLTAVGMALGVGGDEALPAPFFHPDKWTDSWTSVKVDWRIEPARIILPGNRQHASLRIEVSGPID